MRFILFPLEIEETILDLLAEDDEGFSTLKSCSLVCQAFLPICRKHIFGTIILNEHDVASSLTTHSFESLLRETPKIAGYIRKLVYHIEIADLSSPSIQESLKRISRLKFLAVSHSHRPCLNWSDNPIRPALLHLLHLPTITHFMMDDMNNFVVSDLIPCVNLKFLDIGDNVTVTPQNTFPAALPEHSIQLDEFIADTGEIPTAIMKLYKTRRPDGQPIIDFGSLSKLTVIIENRNEGEDPKKFFGDCHFLTFVHVSFWEPENARPSLADMFWPSMQTLKHIVVDIDVYFDVDALFGIPSDLEEMRTKNIIETITLGIVIHTNANSFQGDWGRLDEVLTKPGWVSLKQVMLTIELAYYDGSIYDEVLEFEEELKILLGAQFPRLSSSKSVSFNFEVGFIES